ncbi:uncharacterized protein [Dysidea avara]|uniref:uncharacterized protein n=1 Tax=Dysidea avara TaxID=196820 RepID=UPI003334351F
MSQLAVCSVLFSMMILCAHSAPVPARRDTNEQCNTFYCKSRDLFNHLGSIENGTRVYSVEMSDTFNKNYINSTLHQFDIACKNFTTIMAIKHQLQHSIFNGICSIDSVLSGLVVTLSYLQTLADIIQEVKKTECNEQCIKFGHDEYRMIYYTLFDDAANTSILEIARNSSKAWAQVLKTQGSTC